MKYIALFMAKEAVASWNIEHPEKPMTLTEYFVSMAAAERNGPPESKT